MCVLNRGLRKKSDLKFVVGLLIVSLSCFVLTAHHTISSLAIYSLEKRIRNEAADAAGIINEKYVKHKNNLLGGSRRFYYISYHFFVERNKISAVKTVNRRFWAQTKKLHAISVSYLPGQPELNLPQEYYSFAYSDLRISLTYLAIFGMMLFLSITILKNVITARKKRIRLSKRLKQMCRY